MKVTLKVQHKTKQLLPIRDALDLYSRTQSGQLIQTISENFNANIKQTETTISELTNELDNYQIKRIKAMQPQSKRQKANYHRQPGKRPSTSSRMRNCRSSITK